MFGAAIVLFSGDRPFAGSGTDGDSVAAVAYYIAVARGCDVNNPRNLPNSVAVE